MGTGNFKHRPLTFDILFFTADNGIKISCCKYGVRIPKSDIHAECYPVVLPANDPFYKQFGEQCMELVRSVYAPRPSCYMGPREQVSTTQRRQAGQSLLVNVLD